MKCTIIKWKFQVQSIAGQIYSGDSTILPNVVSNVYCLYNSQRTIVLEQCSSLNC